MHASGNLAIDKDSLWTQTLAELKLQMTRGTFEAHFAGSYPAAMENGSITIVVRNPHSVEQIMNRLKATVERTLKAFNNGETMEVSVVTQDQDIPRMQEIARGKIAADAAGNGSAGTRENGKGNGRPAVEVKPDENVKIKGKGPTRASAVPNASFLQVSHYAIRFWLPIVGVRSFTLWQVIYSHKVGAEYGWNKEPSLRQLMYSADIANHTNFKEALATLESFDLITIGERPDNKQSKYLFEVADFPIITFDQHFDNLKGAISDLHLAWLKRFAERGFFNFKAWRAGADPAECILVQKFAEN
jgi:hypothetical protein